MPVFAAVKVIAGKMTDDIALMSGPIKDRPVRRDVTFVMIDGIVYK